MMSSYPQLTQRQRYQVGPDPTEFQLSQAGIARCLGVNRSTVSRELKRNGCPRRGQSRADRVQQKARARSRQKVHRRIPDALRRQVEALALPHYPSADLMGT